MFFFFMFALFPTLFIIRKEQSSKKKSDAHRMIVRWRKGAYCPTTTKMDQQWIQRRSKRKQKRANGKLAVESIRKAKVLFPMNMKIARFQIFFDLAEHRVVFFLPIALHFLEKSIYEQDENTPLCDLFLQSVPQPFALSLCTGIFLLCALLSIEERFAFPQNVSVPK